MAVTLDVSGTGQSNAGTSTTITINLTLGASANYLLVAVNFDQASTEAVTGVTWNGVALTNIGGAIVNFMDAELWRLTNPATGAHSAVITFNVAPDNSIAAAMSFNGVDTAGTPEGVVATNSGTASATVNVASASGDLVVATVSVDNTSVTDPQTQIYDAATTGGVFTTRGHGSDKVATTTTTALSWTLTVVPSAWTAAGVALKAGGAAALITVLDEPFQHSYVPGYTSLRQEYMQDWTQRLLPPPTAAPLYPETENLLHAPVRPNYVYQDEGAEFRSVFPIVTPNIVYDETGQQPLVKPMVQDDVPWHAFLPSVPLVFDPQFMPQLEEIQVAFIRLLRDDSSIDVLPIILPPAVVDELILQPPVKAVWDENSADVFPIILPPVVMDEPLQQPLFKTVWDEADTWYAFLPAAPVVFDPQNLPQEEGLQFARFPRIYDDTSDNVVQIFLPPFDMDDARIAMAPPPQPDLPWDVLPIFLPPFVTELQVDPKTRRDYMWLEPVTLDDWLQPPAAGVVNTTATGRSTRLGLLFPAMR